MIEDGGKTKGVEGCSSSIKRLISPPQESNNAKKPRTINSPAKRTLLSPTSVKLKVTRPMIGPLKTSHFSRKEPEGHSRGTEVVSNDNRNKMLSLKSVWKRDMKEGAKNGNDSGFTVITEQKATEAKASGNPHTHSGNTLTAHTHKPVAQTITPATHTSGEMDLNKRGATGTAMTSSNGDEDNATSSDQRQAGGTLIHFDYN